MLRSLLSAHGVSPKMITVYIDGYFEVGVFIDDYSMSIHIEHIKSLCPDVFSHDVSSVNLNVW